MPTISSFKNIENKYDVFRCKDRIKKLHESLRKHVVEMIDLKKNEAINKRTAVFISKCKNLLYLQRKI